MLIKNPKLNLSENIESPLIPKDWYHDINVYKFSMNLIFFFQNLKIINVILIQTINDIN